MRKVSLSRGMLALVDEQDYDRVLAAGPWNAHVARGRMYAVHSVRARGAGCKIRMHNLILGAIGVDHIDGDGLNNQRHNLRVASVSQNRANIGVPANNTSGFKGVSQRRNPGPWIAKIGFQRARIDLGAYPTPEEAARAYDEAARRYFGEFARLNFPKEGEN